jgi:16S rRNA (cytidine1402-2'-O)-methyltransferase
VPVAFAVAVIRSRKSRNQDEAAHARQPGTQANHVGALYIVSTPIGNLADMTVRGIETLKSVRRVLAEDTRRTAILLRHYGIETPLVSAHEHNEAGRAEQVVAWLEAGEDLALVSDAGTPLLSDPGLRIVRRALDARHAVVPIPGASALLAALVGSGIEPEPFTFFGFPPRSGRARAQLLETLASLDHTAVLYEAPGRLLRLLNDLATACGAGRHVAVGRELTKLHETFVRGTLAETIVSYDGRSIRGEVVVVLAGGGPESQSERPDAAALARSLLQQGTRPSAVARELARSLGLARNEAYEIALAEAADTEGKDD